MRRILLLIAGLLGSVVTAAILLQSTVHGLSLEKNALHWPYAVDQTPLRVLAFESYDGPFPEDGSCEQVRNVASVVLENTGSTTLRNGAVKLLQGKQVLVFSFTMLPPGEKILVMEKSRKFFSPEPVTSCWGWSLNQSADHTIRVEEYGRSGFLVTNLGNKAANTTICFKTYDPVRTMFIGGYTYRITVSDLRPGVARVFPAYRYIRGAYRIVH